MLRKHCPFGCTLGFEVYSSVFRALGVGLGIYELGSEGCKTKKNLFSESFAEMMLRML